MTRRRHLRQGSQECSRTWNRNRFLPEDGERVNDAMLFLSGGSQHGAYGAGYLAQWSRIRSDMGKDGLPRFRMVTGISRGCGTATSRR